MNRNTFFILEFKILAFSIAFACFGFTSKANAGTLPLDIDAGFRVSIYDENYKMGLGGELGLVTPVDSNWSVGLHLNTTLFNAKTKSWDDAYEYGGYITAYYNPHVNQPFTLLLGPHLGFAKIIYHYFDLGADLKALFLINPKMNCYVNFIPAMMVGNNSQSLIRLGLGMQYRMGP
jgi:hypothetical protein